MKQQIEVKTVLDLINEQLVEIRATYLRLKYDNKNDMAAQKVEALWHLSDLKDRIVNMLIEQILD